MIAPRAFGAGPGALQQARQVGEHARRIAARHRRLAGGQRDVARGMGEAGDAIDDQQHRLAAVAEIFGDGHRGLGREAAHHRAFVAGGDDGDGLVAVVAERVVEKLAHLAAALADQRDDDGVEIGRARQHRQQRGFADAGAGEHADALAGAERREQVDDADAGLDRLARRGRASAPAAARRRAPSRARRRRSAPPSSSGRPSASMTRPFQLSSGHSVRLSAR